VRRVLTALWLAGSVLAQQIALPQRNRDAGVVRWGSDAEGGAPFVYPDPRTGKEIGFEVDLAQELGRVLGVRFERRQAGYESLVQVLDRGDCDVVLNGFEPTPARLQQVRFTRPYYVFQQQLSVGPSGREIKALADCARRRVGVLGQSQSHQLLQTIPGVEIIVYESNVTAYEDVVNGRNAASLADLPIARALRPMFPALVDVGEPFGEYFYAMAVRRSEPALVRALDQALEQLLADGTLERIYRAWGLWVPAESVLSEPRVARMFAEPDSAARPAPGLDWSMTLRLLWGAARNTLLISVVAFFFAMVLGLLIALTRLHGPVPLRWLAIGYVELFRGTPILVQMLFLYFGLGQFEWLQMTALKAGILGLGLNYAAYEAEVYRAALSAIPRGQREAALALGLSGGQTLRHVVIPQALRLSLAATTNDFIALFKDSSIVSVITVVELTKQYQMLANESGRFILLGLVTSGLYLAMSLPLAVLARRFELMLDRDRT
jgi:polar amino acid transport system substrate-binding protein